MQKYKFYMQEVAWDEVQGEYSAVEGSSTIDLEEYEEFKGLKYIKCEGLENVGEANVYTEEFADSDRLRVYVPENVTHKATEVKLTLIFIGEKRRASFKAFNSYIERGFHAYWDTARNKKLIFFVKNAVKPSEDIYKGGKPYIEVTYTLSNVYGKTTNVN